MSRIYFSLPYINSLETETGWRSDPEAKDTYSVVRCHFMLDGPNQVGTIKNGEIINAIQTLKGLEQEVTTSDEYELTTVKVDEAIAESLKEEETVEQFVSSLSLGLGPAKGTKLSTEIKDSLTTKLHASFKESFKVQVSESLRTKKTITWKGKIDQDGFATGQTIVLTKAYKQYKFDLYLLLIDYLLVEYTSSLLYLRRSKSPPIIKGKHSNFIKLDLPLASILYWQQLPNTILTYNEKQYKLAVEDPSEILVQDLKVFKKHPVKLPPKPSLYDISENTFPRKKAKYW